MFAYKVTGGKPVTGEIRCLGAKNFVTKAMVCSLLGDGPTILTNVPAIGDVDITKNLLESIGAKVKWMDATTLQIDPTKINTYKVNTPDSRSSRIPILLVPALLHRLGKASVPRVGGCKLGARQVDFHIEAAKLFGAEVKDTKTGYASSVKGKRLVGTHYEMPYPSVGATETFLFLASMAEGTSIISNAAVEPEIMELITMLRSMGAVIFLSPNREIRVEGVKKLSGTKMFVLGDRIEAASWASLACASNGDITVHGIRPDTLGNYLSYFRQIGGGFEFVGNESIRFFRASELKPAMMETGVYPGFSTDWQQPFAILLTQANGFSVVHETVYESRFGYLETLNKLGAKTQLTTHCMGEPCRYENHDHLHSALIMGKTPLKAIDEPIEVPDLRAGLAYVIAAVIAKGTSLITNIDLLERGYGKLEERMVTLSIDLEKVEIPDGKVAAKNWFKKFLEKI